MPTQDENGDQLYLDIHRFTGENKHPRPAVVMVHGLEGDSDSLYIVKVAERLLRAGFHVVRMNLRTCGRGLRLARRAYNAGLTIDVETVLDYVRGRIARHVALCGFSLGANLTLKLLGEDVSERDRQLRAFGSKKRAKRRRQPLADVFVAVSPPLDLQRCCELLDAPDCRLYRDMFLKEIKNRARHGKFGARPDLEEELDYIRNFFEFDHRMTAPAGGFKSALQYYETASALSWVDGIRTPGLILHAEDDPMIHMGGWTEARWERFSYIQAELTRYGGHLGWLGRKHPLFPDRRWMDYRIVSYLNDWRDSLK